MSGYICVTCNKNCYFTDWDYSDYDGILCPYSKEYTVLEPEVDE